MINQLLFGMLCLICSLIILEGINLRSKIFQFPFLMAATSISFVIPQAFALVNPSQTAFVVQEQAITRVLIMSCLCIGMCWVGYQLTLPRAWFESKITQLDSGRLTTVNIVYIAIGIGFGILVSAASATESLSGRSSGSITILIFFARLFANTGFAIALLGFFQNSRNLQNQILLCLASVTPFYWAFGLGRRTGLAMVILAFAIACYFFRRYTPPRIVIVLTIALSIFLIPFIGQQRGFTSDKWQDFERIEYTESIENIIEGDNSLELRNAALIMDAVAVTGRHEWGKGYWNALVFRYVPAQLLGRGFKDSLRFSSFNYEGLMYYLYQYRLPTGTTPTGIGDSFIQFDYFGCLFFAIMAIVYKWLWYRALHQNSMVAQIFYIVSCTYAMTSITHGTANFIPNMLLVIISLLPVILYAGIKKSNSVLSLR